MSKVEHVETRYNLPNLTNIASLINGNIIRCDLKKLYHIHRVYEEKRRRI